MPRIPYESFIGAAFGGSAPFSDDELLQNLYPEVTPQGSKSRISYFHTPGTTLYCTLPMPIIYGMISVAVSGGFSDYVLAGNGTALPHLYALSATTPFYSDLGQLPGTILTQPTAYQMKWNGSQLFILGIYGPSMPGFALEDSGSCAAWYFWNHTNPSPPHNYINTLAEIGIPYSQMRPVAADFLDGFMIVANGASTEDHIYGNIISASNSFDLTTWNSLSFATVTDEPDILVGVHEDHQQIFVFGTTRTAVWYDAGNYPFPLQRIAGAVIEAGAVSALAINTIGANFYWISRNDQGKAIACRNLGYSAQRISTNAVEASWQSYATISDATSYGIQMYGHSWWVVSFPTAQITWVYDIGAGIWFTWRYGAGYSALARYHCYDPSLDQHFCGGGDQTGNVYTLSRNVYTDNGQPIFRQRIAPYIQEEMRTVFFNEFELNALVGDGAWSYAISWSDDGGNTWKGPINITGASGNYMARVRKLGLGSSRSRLFSVTTSDPLPQAWVGAWLDIDVGTW